MARYDEHGFTICVLHQFKTHAEWLWLSRGVAFEGIQVDLLDGAGVLVDRADHCLVAMCLQPAGETESP